MNLDFLRLGLIAAELWLLAGAFLILLIGMFAPARQNLLSILSPFFHLVAILWLVIYFSVQGEGFHGFIFADAWSQSLKILLISGSLFCVLMGSDFLKIHKIHSAEFYFLTHIVLISMLFLVSSEHLFFIYLCLETASITSFVLAALDRKSLFSVEGAMKYFLLNAFSSAILLYGIVLIFGASGSFELEQIQNFLSKETIHTLPALGVLLITVGFGFKISLVPFHMWAPDLYEGSPLNITAFFSTPLKISFIAVFAKICISAFYSYSQVWITVIFILTALSLMAGNLLALAQHKVKRVLAYSSISHAGFLMLGVLSFSFQGIASLFFYFTVYSLGSLGVFASIIYLTGKKEVLYFDDLRGLGFSYPLTSSLLIFFLFSLAGIPITGGFIGKLYLFYASLQNGYLILVILGMLASLISVGYYFRFGIKLFSKAYQPTTSQNISSLGAVIVFSTCAFLLLILGLFPSLLDGIIFSLLLR